VVLGQLDGDGAFQPAGGVIVGRGGWFNASPARRAILTDGDGATVFGRSAPQRSDLYDYFVLFVTNIAVPAMPDGASGRAMVAVVPGHLS
jgi:hypothetical protein